MEINVTLSEVLEKCDDWNEFCKERGWSEYAVNEGGGDIVVQLTTQECVKYGILKMYE